MILVDTDQICAALKDVFEDTRAITGRPAPLAVAAFKACTPSANSSAVNA